MTKGQPTRICAVVFSQYPQDSRVRRESEALVEAGMQVDVICLKADSQPSREIVDNVRVFRLPVQQQRAGKLRYVWEYFAFSVLAFLQLSLLYMRERYSLIHIHNMPDFLVFCALIPRLAGAKIILDSHDPVPEVFMSKYAIPASSVLIQVLLVIERCSVRFAHLVIMPTLACRALFLARGYPAWKIHVVLNSPQERFFQRTQVEIIDEVQSKRESFTLMFHGTVVERYGLDNALEALALVHHEIPNLVFHVYGTGDYVDQFQVLVDKLKLRDIVQYHGYVPVQTIVIALASIDIGIIPNKPSAHWNVCLPTRIFEYLSMGKPVIVPRIKGIQDYFDEQAIHFYESGNAQSLAETLLAVYRDPFQSQAVLKRGVTVYHAHRWELQKQHLVTLVRTLLVMTDVELERKMLVLASE
jgi:glycosyltransferase involved in cell wall biosynthesis